MDKYKDLFQLANTIGQKNPDVKEEGGQAEDFGQDRVSARCQPALGQHQDPRRLGK